jgi:hypothetical protein
MGDERTLNLSYAWKCPCILGNSRTRQDKLGCCFRREVFVARADWFLIAILIVEDKLPLRHIGAHESIATCGDNLWGSIYAKAWQFHVTNALTFLLVELLRLVQLHRVNLQLLQPVLLLLAVGLRQVDMRITPDWFRRFGSIDRVGWDAAGGMSARRDILFAGNVGITVEVLTGG